MDTLQAFILGLVQGLAEYLPISSSGHLEIFREILGIDMSGADSIEFDVTLHVATVLSTLVVLWKEFVPLCQSFFTFKNDENTAYVWKILLSCIPIGIVGVFFKDQIEMFFGDGLLLVGICLCITAALLAFSYFYRTKPSKERHLRGRNITWLDALTIGIAQSIAVLPGLSRSGTTIATGIIIGDNRAKVAQFSFFMVIIPILGEALLGIKDLVTEGVNESVGAIPLLVGFITSFIVGCIACKWMINLVKKGKLVWFSLYCVIVGVICILYSVG